MRRLFERLVQLVPTTVGALVLVFALMRIVPGDPAAAMLGTNATPLSVADLRSQLGLDRPLYQQFVDYFLGLAQLDLGRSLALRTPVSTLLWQALGPTLLLTLGGTLVSVVVGVPLGIVARITRSSLLSVLAHDYVRTARAKGLGPQAVIGNHALRNGLIPVLTVIGLNLGTLLGGAVVAETVFTRPGLGRLMLDAISARDYPVIQGVVVVSVLFVVVLNLLVDVLYSAVDPRVRA